MGPAGPPLDGDAGAATARGEGEDGRRVQLRRLSGRRLPPLPLLQHVRAQDGLA